MSHAATNWAIQQRGLKPATKILLWHLCDRHNKDTKRCDPSQDRLADDTEMSRATVNRHLDLLELAALLRRVPRFCQRTKKQLSTCYELAFDHDLAVSQNETRAVSQKTPKPCLKNGDSRVSNCDTNLVREPVTKPCASEAEPQTIDFDIGFLDDFIAVYPRSGVRDVIEAELIDALKSGALPDDLIGAAKSYAVEQKGNEVRYIALPQNWLSQRRWEQHAVKADNPKLAPSIHKSWIDAFVGAKGNLARHCPSEIVRQLLKTGEITREQCRAVEVSF
jgi:hypothetical protein